MLFLYRGESHAYKFGGGGCRKFQVSNKTLVVGRVFFGGGGVIRQRSRELKSTREK